MKRTIKLAAEAFKPANLARGLRPASPEEIEAALEHATPEQRAAYHAQMARADAAMEDARVRDEARRVLFGPAGLAVHGPTVAEQQGASLRFARLELKQTVRQVLGRPEVPQIEDPVQRSQHAAAARAARDQARAPYRAPDAIPIHIS